jgi:uncharacterized protein YdeI (YjbR/CyaY-like superfamily)
LKRGLRLYAILHRLQTAKKAETRTQRMEQFIQMLAKHEKLYPEAIGVVKPSEMWRV